MSVILILAERFIFCQRRVRITFGHPRVRTCVRVCVHTRARACGVRIWYAHVRACVCARICIFVCVRESRRRVGPVPAEGRDGRAMPLQEGIGGGGMRALVVTKGD